MTMDPMRELPVPTTARIGMDETPERAAARYAADARMHEHRSAQPGYDAVRELALASWAYECSLQLLRSTS
jgi:hypothetical protein